MEEKPVDDLADAGGEEAADGDEGGEEEEEGVEEVFNTQRCSSFRARQISSAFVTLVTPALSALLCSALL